MSHLTPSQYISKIFEAKDKIKQHEKLIREVESLKENVKSWTKTLTYDLSNLEHLSSVIYRGDTYYKVGYNLVAIANDEVTLLPNRSNYCLKDYPMLRFNPEQEYNKLAIDHCTNYPDYWTYDCEHDVYDVNYEGRLIEFDNELLNNNELYYHHLLIVFGLLDYCEEDSLADSIYKVQQYKQQMAATKMKQTGKEKDNVREA